MTTYRRPLSIEEFGDLLGISRSQARRIVVEERLVEHIKVGRKYGVPYDVALKFKDACTVAAAR